MNTDFLAGKNILTIDDNSINQMLVKHALSKTGATIVAANNGVVALEILKKNTFDAILMDIQMPELNGYETTQFIRNELKLTLPIVAMTALAIKGEADRCITAGMNGYISKPFTKQGLYAALEKAITASTPITNNHCITDGEITVDFNLLNKAYHTDEDYIPVALGLFIDNLSVTVKNINQNCTTENTEELQQNLRLLKSSLSLISIYKLNSAIQKTQLSLLENTINISISAPLVEEVLRICKKANILLQIYQEQLLSNRQVA